jgi:formate C-acetyltransferase
MEFGRRTHATPDARYAGDGFMVGTGQCGGKDRNGLLALMQSLAQMDPTGILCGPNVCNMMIDGALMKNDEYFDKVCLMIEEYFKLGGLHVQLNYVTKEELLAAREDPAKHGHLKVRVSGFSASFNVLPELMQEEIVNRTVQQA